ncbi:hypothetical protein ED733_002482 [Metarhizium rileyi]|uniref:BTB domain-containing protein n=1 Tax=Metarhizium rileyi (strain RCEF 4871) TaxID=1649241 RepID=A0A5C6G5H2_METRR|nr:hypothetical protein ED733_002482 [Metarhizium rileyi]
MNEAIASSEPFRFLVGPRKREFTIHSAVVANQSRSLDRLVNGEFVEGNDKTVRWEDVDEETFLCFWQYAYTGDYDVPRESETPDVEMEGEEDGGDKTPEYTDISPNFYYGTNDRITNNNTIYAWRPSLEKSKRDKLWEAFAALSSSSGSKRSAIKDKKSRDHLNARGLLRDARVYVFADCYGITPLMNLSFDMLHQSLYTLDLRTENLADIVALIHYCYETPTPVGLKQLVVLYAACNVEKLWADEQFRHLLETHGDFSTSLVGSLLSRLC